MARGIPSARAGGFTLIELVSIMILIGIMATVAIPRFASTSAFETRGFVDQTLASMQYAHKVAVAAGRNVCVSASSGGNTLTTTMSSARGQSQACGSAIANPAANWKTYSGIAYGSALSTTFYGDGSALAVASFSVTGAQTYTLTVESTGYVHCTPVSDCS